MACAGAICNITNFLLNQLMNRRSVAAGQSILDLRMDPALIVLIVAVSHGQRASRRDTGLCLITNKHVVMGDVGVLVCILTATTTCIQLFELLLRVTIFRL